MNGCRNRSMPSTTVGNLFHSEIFDVNFRNLRTTMFLLAFVFVRGNTGNKAHRSMFLDLNFLRTINAIAMIRRTKPMMPTMVPTNAATENSCMIAGLTNTKS